MKIPSEKIEYHYGPTYIRSKPDSITRPDIAHLVDHYKQHISHRLVPLHPDLLTRLEQPDSRWNFGEKILTSVKVDGEGVLWIYDAMATDYQSYFANDSTHRIWMGLPVNYELEALCKSQGITQMILAGELMVGQLKGEIVDFEGRSRVPDLLHVTRNPRNAAELNRVGFKAFDIVQLENQDWLSKPYMERIAKVQSLLPSTGRAAAIILQLLPKDQIVRYYDTVVRKGGAEGLILRNPTTNQGYKVKPIHDIDAVIIGVLENPTEENNYSYLTAVRHPDGTYQVLATVGTGLSDTDLLILNEKLQFVTSKYVGVGSEGRAFHMVLPEIVVRVEYLDIVTEHSPKNPVFQPILNFDLKKKEWNFIASQSFIKLISSRFAGENPIREDKDGTVENVRISQITDFISIFPVTLSQKTNLPSSEILQRIVFEKEEMVKKFLLIQTHKSEIDRTFAEYAIVFVDFSPKRQIRLQRNAKITNNPSQAKNLFQSWIAEEMMNTQGTELKRGWSKYSEQDMKMINSSDSEINASKPPKKARISGSTSKSTKIKTERLE